MSDSANISPRTSPKTARKGDAESVLVGPKTPPSPRQKLRTILVGMRDRESRVDTVVVDLETGAVAAETRDKVVFAEEITGDPGLAGRLIVASPGEFPSVPVDGSQGAAVGLPSSSGAKEGGLPAVPVHRIAQAVSPLGKHKKDKAETVDIYQVLRVIVGLPATHEAERMHYFPTEALAYGFIDRLPPHPKVQYVVMKHIMYMELPRKK